MKTFTGNSSYSTPPNNKAYRFSKENIGFSEEVEPNSFMFEIGEDQTNVFNDFDAINEKHTEYYR